MNSAIVCLLESYTLGSRRIRSTVVFPLANIAAVRISAPGNTKFLEAISARTAIVLRVPRKYRYLIRAFGVWLKEYPDQASLWQCEEYLSQTFEESAYKVDSPAWRNEINAAQIKVFNHIKFSR